MSATAGRTAHVPLEDTVLTTAAPEECLSPTEWEKSLLLHWLAQADVDWLRRLAKITAVAGVWPAGSSWLDTPAGRAWLQCNPAATTRSTAVGRRPAFRHAALPERPPDTPLPPRRTWRHFWHR